MYSEYNRVDTLSTCYIQAARLNRYTIPSVELQVSTAEPFLMRYWGSNLGPLKEQPLLWHHPLMCCWGLDLRLLDSHLPTELHLQSIHRHSTDVSFRPHEHMTHVLTPLYGRQDGGTDGLPKGTLLVSCRGVPSTHDIEAGGSEICSQLRLHSECKVSLGYMSLKNSSGSVGKGTGQQAWRLD